MADLRSAEANLRERVRQVAVEASQQLLAQQQQETVIRTGNLHNRLQVTDPTTTGSTVIFELIDTAIYAGAYAYGARPHTIRPRNASVLRFTVGTRVVFARSVNHPGNAAHPAWWSADTLRRRFNDALSRVVD